MKLKNPKMLFECSGCGLLALSGEDFIWDDSKPANWAYVLDAVLCLECTNEVEQFLEHME